MNLKEIVTRLFEERKTTPSDGLGDIYQAEIYLQQAYEGRYFFELIQNVRDANKEIETDGSVFIDLSENTLVISNTGAEFSSQGIKGITRIGKSSKSSQDFIGFKGIGFKSIQEITEEPKIITQYGSVYFDRKLTLKHYVDKTLEEDEIPLFYFPHFNDRKLSIAEVSQGIVTKIELLIKENVTEEKIIEAFSEIQAKQLILLGNIEKLHFTSANYIKKFTIKKTPERRFIEVQEDDNSILKFKYFTPRNKIIIPEPVIQLLSGKEKKIFSNSSSVDINIVLEIAENGQIKSIDDAKLYLFYPLQISSGFRFIIHSYFIVNPERTALRNSPLNDFLFLTIGKFIGYEMLRQLKETKINTTKILCFKRNKDAQINLLYDSVVAELKKQKFIFNSQTKRYFSASEVVVADGFDKGLFPEGKFGGKQLIYTDDQDVIEWLKDEFQVPYLDYGDIANEIEVECKKQLKNKQTKFFQNLYNYVGQHEKLNLTGRKVLLTDQCKLVSSDEDVFFGGNRNPIRLAPSIKKQIHFIHRDIKINKTDFREGRSRTGITEFSTYELVRRLLKLFNKVSVPNEDLLNALYNLHHQFDSKSELEIKEKILLKVKGNSKWLSPLTYPIYFELENIKDLYPDGNFIDLSFLKRTDETGNLISVEDFLKQFGVWEIPAIYINDKRTRLLANEKRNKHIENSSGLTSKPYFVKNDRVLDRPSKYNNWFTNTIIDNYGLYEAFIISKLLPTLQYDSNQSYVRNANSTLTLKFSGFIEVLSNEKWIVIQGEDENYSVNEIVGIKNLDLSQSHNQVIGRYLNLLSINYDLKKEFVEAIGLIHLDGNSIQNFINLLNHIYKFETEIPPTKDFVDFYNRILSKLFDFFYNNYQTSITQLKDEFFLSIDDISKTSNWTKAKQMFYIDDKLNYDLLPVSIKQKVQPHFTNRDKNTFGKIASKIGNRFSNSVRKELMYKPPIQTSTLLTFFKFLPESIAILEFSLDIVMNEYFGRIKNIKVFEEDIIEVKISVDNSEELIIPVNHFVNNDLDIHLSIANNLNVNKLIAESISELFINLLGRDLRKYHSDLFRFLNTVDKMEYLKDYDISEERVNEIRDKLNVSDLNANQKFWEAILNVKKISTRENVFANKSITLSKISELLDINETQVQIFQDKFNFQQTSVPSNVNLLSNLIDLLSITLEQLNKHLFPKIDFREYYGRKLVNIKDKFENSFNAILYNYLINKSNEEQANYQNILDDYKRSFVFVVPLNTIDLHLENFFLESANLKFTSLEILSDDFNKDFSSFNPISIYSSNISLLRSRLISIEFTNENIETFLAENKRRSLLYFNKVDFLVENFKEWLVNFKKLNKSSDEESDWESFLSEFINQTDIKIEEVSTERVDAPLSKGGASVGGNGNRFDGAANDFLKKRIGLVAEMVVYEKLKTIYKDVLWVSKYASKIFKTHQGYNPEGQDGLGYDIEYFDDEGNKFFVEVKGKADDFDSFEISKNELNNAYLKKEFYKIIFVTQTMNNSQRRIRDLGNLFMLEDGENFLVNRKFNAIYRNFEIRFKEQ